MKDKIKYLRFIPFIIIFLFILGSGVGFFYTTFIIFWLLSFGLILYLVLYSIKHNEFKQNVVKKTLEEYKKGLRYTFKPMDVEDYKEMIRSLKVIPSASTFKFTDQIFDTTENYTYTSFDLVASHVQSSGNHSHTVIDFKGKLYDVAGIELPCDFILKEEWLKRTPYGYEFLELESIEFNKKLNLYVSDTFEAQKIFTPSVIKSYIELVGNDSDTTFTIYLNGHLYFFITNNENQFENKKGNKETIIAEYKKQLEVLETYYDVFSYKY